jgi:hypothetical protein
MSVTRCIKNALGTLALLLGQSCADTTPLPFAGSDGGAQDGAVVPQEVIERCRECSTGETSLCPAAYQECAADPRCFAFMTCVLETGCLVSGELQVRISCAEPCFRSTGIQAGTDESLQRGLGLNACTLPAGPCGSACVIE